MVKMNENSNVSGGIIEGFFGSFWYFILAMVVSIPIFIAVESYVKSVGIHEDEAVSFAATVCFMLGVFAGRYIAGIWMANTKTLPKAASAGMILLIIACTAWVFFHADFPLRERVAINLMLFWLPLVMISIATGALIKMVHAVNQHQLKEAQREVAQSKSELHLLQSQLSPHFLFNTLNNLYGLSITNHEKIPPLLLKLSELLRYSVYDASDVYVPLKDEITYIKNYIEFEKIRIGDRLVLTTDVEEMMDADVKIAPMLLIVFIENAFKHSKNTATDNIFIDIKLKTWGNSILFSVKNTYGKEVQDNNILNKSSGMGLPNVAKRLELLYHNAHELSVRSDEMFYKVELQLKMKSNE
ncbi:GHKL domain-containing protein [Chitinophaga sp. CF118]|uniref:sensor histidine kinase n=1 Tax=Chitinophaga sp. CF118 TaxID=1884367 RepID=UPI0008E91D01|nr:histidine kinase [Chitinophaga sp. CF118]SFF01393.1 GHKL domain-containing protein [Chitinophaga sp. CF118]